MSFTFVKDDVIQCESNFNYFVRFYLIQHGGQHPPHPDFFFLAGNKAAAEAEQRAVRSTQGNLLVL